MTKDLLRLLVGIIVADFFAAVLLPLAAQSVYGDPTLGILLAAVIVVASLVGWVKLWFGK